MRRPALAALLLTVLAACGGGLSAEEKDACSRAVADKNAALDALSADLSATDIRQYANDYGQEASRLRADVAGLDRGSEVRRAVLALAAVEDRQAAANVGGSLSLAGSGAAKRATARLGSVCT